MADMSDVLEVQLLNATLNGVAYTAVNNPYISLWTSNPTDAESGTEVSGGSYARTPSSFATASGTTGVVLSDADATFPTATATSTLDTNSSPGRQSPGTGEALSHYSLCADAKP